MGQFSRHCAAVVWIWFSLVAFAYQTTDGKQSVDNDLTGQQEYCQKDGDVQNTPKYHTSRHQHSTKTKNFDHKPASLTPRDVIDINTLDESGYFSKIVRGNRSHFVDIYVCSSNPTFYNLLGQMLPTTNIAFFKMDGRGKEDDKITEQIEILLADLPTLIRYRNRLNHVKWVHTTIAGVDSLLDAIHKANEPLPTFTLTKTLGVVFAPYMSDYVIGYVIATERRMFEMKERQERRSWHRAVVDGRRLSDVTIGFLGTGAIAQYIAKRCKSLGMTVWGFSRTSKQDKEDSFDRHKTKEELPEFLQSCDYIVGILPSTPSTRGLLSGGVLEHCKRRKSVFINVGRGDLVDEASLITAIKNKWISKAILDVFPKEPLPKSSPLWTLPGVTITPHISGFSMEPSLTEDILKNFVANYDRYANNLPLLGVLNWEQGY